MALLSSADPARINLSERWGECCRHRVAGKGTEADSDVISNCGRMSFR